MTVQCKRPQSIAINMANLHRVRDTLASAYFCDILDDEEFMLLYDINAPSNPDFQYENDGYRFEIDNFNDDECNSYFRFFTQR